MDLNSDLGEGYGAWTLGDDDGLLNVVTSANVACGFHAGDPSIMRRVCSRAARLGVAIGAQVGYPDLAGFGRRFIDMAPDDLTDAITYQIGALQAFATAAGSTVAYVKPHGALYNAIVHHERQAAAVVRAVVPWRIPVLGLPGSAVLRQAAEAGVRTVSEAFADRAYRPDGTLVPRSESGAVIDDDAAVVVRALRLARASEVVAVDGSVVRVEAESLCVHGDTPGAVDLAVAIRAALAEAGIEVRRFTEP